MSKSAFEIGQAIAGSVIEGLEQMGGDKDAVTLGVPAALLKDKQAFDAWFSAEVLDGVRRRYQDNPVRAVVIEMWIFPNYVAEGP